MSEATVILYRPVGPKELALISASHFRAFPSGQIEVIAEYKPDTKP